MNNRLRRESFKYTFYRKDGSEVNLWEMSLSGIESLEQVVNDTDLTIKERKIVWFKDYHEELTKDVPYEVIFEDENEYFIINDFRVKCAYNKKYFR